MSTYINFSSRITSFRRMLGYLLLDDIESILEVGCNDGSNLTCLSKMRQTVLIPRRDITYKLYGVDTYPLAIQKARRSDIASFTLVGSYSDLVFTDSYFDCVLSDSTLSYTSPTNLTAVIQEMIRVSRRYILVIESYSFMEENTIPDVAWSRDYSGLFEGMTCIDTGLWNEEDGWDKQTWWLFKKGEPPPRIEFL